jgi:hypothetical protein
MIDTVAEGTGVKKGLIAQEVETIVPEAVSRGKQFVPNIYVQPTAFKYEPTLRQLVITLPKAFTIQAGDQVRIMTDTARFDLPVVAVHSPEKFVLGKCEHQPAQIFVFGTEVSDFRTLNYDRIFTIGVSAIQELSRMLEERTARVAALEEKAATVDALERELAGLKKQLAANEVAQTKWEARFAALEKLLGSAGSDANGTDRLSGIKQLVAQQSR